GGDAVSFCLPALECVERQRRAGDCIGDLGGARFDAAAVRRDDSEFQPRSTKEHVEIDAGFLVAGELGEVSIGVSHDSCLARELFSDFVRSASKARKLLLPRTV